MNNLTLEMFKKLIEEEIAKESLNDANGTTVKSHKRKVYPESIVTKDGEVIEAKTHIVLEDTNLIEISSANYVILNSDSLEYLINILTPSEYLELCKILVNTKTRYNIAFNGNYPHTKKTLLNHLNLSDVLFRKFIKKLQEKGIIYTVKGLSKITRRVEITYLVNPFISRKRKTFDRELSDIFVDVETLKEIHLENGKM